MDKNLKICPVCKGNGVVPIEFKQDTPVWVVEIKFPREPCSLCNGSKLVTKAVYDEYNYQNRPEKRIKSHARKRP